MPKWDKRGSKRRHKRKAKDNKTWNKTRKCNKNSQFAVADKRYKQHSENINEQRRWAMLIPVQKLRSSTQLTTLSRLHALARMLSQQDPPAGRRRRAPRVHRSDSRYRATSGLGMRLAYTGEFRRCSLLLYRPRRDCVYLKVSVFILWCAVTRRHHFDNCKLTYSK